MIFTEEEQILLFWSDCFPKDYIDFHNIIILTKEEQKLIIELDKINSMSHFEMGCLVRHAAIGHTYFDGSRPLWKYFKNRFYSMGGMTLELSKKVGWPQAKPTKEYRKWVKSLEF